MNAKRVSLAAAAAALLLVPFVVPVPDDLERIRSLRMLGVLAHIGLPAVLTFVLYRVGPLRGRLIVAGACALVLASGCELLQTFVQRHPRWQDVGTDLVGVSVAVGWLGRRVGGGRAYGALFVAGLAAVLYLVYSWPVYFMAERQAVRRFPLVADFETSTELALWDLNGQAHGSFGIQEQSEGDHVLTVGVEPQDLYPGVIARGLPRDWSAYEILSFRARLERGAQARINIRLDDFASREDSLWCGEGFPLEAEWRTFEVDLKSAASDVEERPFRLDDIDSLLLYLTRVEDGTTVLIDDIVLR